jgi:hypothetical protein
VTSAESASSSTALAERLRVLSETLGAFAEAEPSYERLLQVVARKLGEVVKDGCVVRRLDADGWLTPTAIHLPLEGRGLDPDVAARLRAPR